MVRTSFYQYFLAKLLFFVIILAGPLALARSWTDPDGKKFDAQFVRINGNQVVLQKGLKVITLPLDSLSPEDREYVEKQSKPKASTKKSTDLPKPKDASPFEDASELIDPTTGSYPVRTWEDSFGNKLSAKFVRLEGSIVILSKNGKDRPYPLDKFSKADRQYISQVTGRGEETFSSTVSAPSSSTSPNILSQPNQGSFDRTISSPSSQQEALADQGQRLRDHFRSSTSPNVQRMVPEPSNTGSSTPTVIYTSPFPTPSPPPPPPAPHFEHFPQPQVQMTKYCTKCMKAVDNPQVGQKCPHCGVYWEAELDASGKVVKRTTAHTIGVVIGGLFVLLVGIAILIKLIGR